MAFFFSLNNIIMQLLQRLWVPVSSKPGASKVTLFLYIREGPLSYRTGRKMLNNQPVHKSKHLEMIFAQFNSSVSKYKHLKCKRTSTTFPVSGNERKE